MLDRKSAWQHNGGYIGMPQSSGLCWDIDSLNKAYRQGYLAGVMGMDDKRCPYSGEVVEAAWEAGWEDGASACELQRPVAHAKQAS